MQSNPFAQQTAGMSEADCATHLREKHIEMIRNEQAHGREIPAVPVSESVVGSDLARQSVEASQHSMRRANTKFFTVPDLPWLRKKVTHVIQ